MGFDFIRLWNWALRSEGSTRPAALIRIGLVFIIWCRWGAEVSLGHHRLSIPRVLLAVLFFAATAMMLAGWQTRAAVLVSGLLCGALYYRGFPEELKWASHHVYFLFAAVMISGLMPSGDSYSIDRWLKVRRARRLGSAIPAEHSNLWAQRLLTIQIAVMYVGAAASKMNRLFLSGDVIEHSLLSSFIGSDYPVWAGFHLLCMGLAWATLVLELTLAGGLFADRLRPWLMASGVFFHGIMYVLLPIETFTATTLLLYISFLNPDQVHRWLDDLQATPAARRVPAATI